MIFVSAGWIHPRDLEVMPVLGIENMFLGLNEDSTNPVSDKGRKA
jgi:hypothetical protein